ncbi:hypothetical protein E2C01_013921 [Portunus trituberculatus]|uniref:Uncharacterized protein n=1 Tax=Portunus trituberculatus TaxID=210409 RepID=A0A5B7DIK2_PORTR|nr:hypothetical protein [Portunus trituberculatus]
MKYDWADSTQAFVIEFICQYSILQTKFDTEELPNRDQLIKKKLLRGMPTETHDKLSSFLKQAIPLTRSLQYNPRAGHQLLSSVAMRPTEHKTCLYQ